MRDLVRWMRFQACAQQEQQQQQALFAAEDANLLDGPVQQQEQQQGLGAARDPELSNEAMHQHHHQQQQQLELMKAVGMNLLEYSLSQSMEAVAGEGRGCDGQLHGGVCVYHGCR
eukprot:156606-Pelagomonas_calceolata.AAC.2